MTSDEVYLLFDKWWSEGTVVTCTFLGERMRARITGTIDRIVAGSVFLRSGDDAALLQLSLNSVHLVRYCEPRELGVPEGQEKCAALLIIHLNDGNVLQFAELK
jgi:hypothetical protein